MKLNKTKKNTIVTFFTILMMMFVFTSFVMPAVAKHTLEITPESPIAGDEVVISGTASPGESVELTIIFEKRIQVVNGRYSYTFEGIQIPDKDNVFTVTSKSVRDLTVAVQLLVVWIPVSLNATNNVATISQTNVPAGTYTIRIQGNAALYEPHVDLIISASSKTIADSNGNFEFRHSTTGIPPGTFNVRVGNVERTVTLHKEYISQPPPPSRVPPVVRPPVDPPVEEPPVDPPVEEPPVDPPRPPRIPRFGIIATILRYFLV